MWDQTSQSAEHTAQLSDRQREILLLIAAGHSAIEIAKRLQISPGTVENHKRRLYAKLNASSAVHAVARAASYGIIDERPTPEPALAPEEPTDTDRMPLVVAAGVGRDLVDRVLETLIAHQFPVFREHNSSAARYGHWWRWHRGPVVRVLVNPTSDHWQTGTTLGRMAVVVHSGPIDRRTVGDLLANGASAVVPADQVTSQLGSVVHLVAKGYLVIDHRYAAAEAQPRPQPPALTSREHDILRSIGDSRTIRQTAMRLGIAVKTVENAQGHLFRKLGVHNRAEALASAYSLGLLRPARRAS